MIVLKKILKLITVSMILTVLNACSTLHNQCGIGIKPSGSVCFLSEEGCPEGFNVLFDKVVIDSVMINYKCKI